MAIFKQGQINQILAVCVDKTDFATVESGVTSNFTCTLYTLKQGASGATSAVALSAAPSVVRSGIIRVKIKADETSGVDNALLKIAHASCADQYIPISFQVQDISDAISNVDSALTSQFSDFQSRVPKAVATASRLLLAESAISDAHSAATKATSQLLVLQSALSDVDSALTSQFSDFQSRVPKAVATSSQLTAVQSDFQSRVPKEVANASQLLLIKSNLSDVESAVDDIYSLLSDVDSNFQSRVPKETANASALAAYVSDFGSRVPKEVANASALLLIKSNLSDVESGADDIYSLLTAVDSNLQSRIPKAVATSSQLTAVQSDFQSRVPKAVATASALTLLASNMSDVESALDSQYAKAYSSIGAVKAKTDKLTFTSGNDLDANVQQVNDVTLKGDGAATPWGPV